MELQCLRLREGPVTFEGWLQSGEANVQNGGAVRVCRGWCSIATPTGLESNFTTTVWQDD